jgi:hypothetical protein
VLEAELRAVALLLERWGQGAPTPALVRLSALMVETP